MQEVRVTSMHTLRVSICSNVGVSLFVLLLLAVVGQKSGTGRCKHPRFFIVVSQKKYKTRSYRVFANNYLSVG